MLKNKDTKQEIIKRHLHNLLMTYGHHILEQVIKAELGLRAKPKRDKQSQKVG